MCYTHRLIECVGNLDYQKYICEELLHVEPPSLPLSAIKTHHEQLHPSGGNRAETYAHCLTELEHLQQQLEEQTGSRRQNNRDCIVRNAAPDFDAEGKHVLSLLHT